MIEGYILENGPDDLILYFLVDRHCYLPSENMDIDIIYCIQTVLSKMFQNLLTAQRGIFYAWKIITSNKHAIGCDVLPSFKVDIASTALERALNVRQWSVRHK